MTTSIDRRSFVKATVVAGAGLTLAFNLPGCVPAKEEGPGADLNAFLQVKPDGSVVATSFMASILERITQVHQCCSRPRSTFTCLCSMARRSLSL